MIKNNVQNISFENYEANISLAIEITKKYIKEIFLINMLPISLEIDDILVSFGKLRTNKHIIENNKVLKSVSVLKIVKYLDIHSIISQSTTAYITKDGVHPNEKGYKMISEVIKPILSQYL